MLLFIGSVRILIYIFWKLLFINIILIVIVLILSYVRYILYFRLILLIMINFSLILFIIID